LAGTQLLGLFDAVAIGHPDGLHALSIGEADKVADGAIEGDKALVDGGQSGAITLGNEVRAQGFGEGRNVVQGGEALAVKSVKELPGTEGRFAESLD
jgi:hypothetical protein